MELNQKLRRFAARPKLTKAWRRQSSALPMGVEVSNPFGRYYMVEHTYPLDSYHGRLRLDSILTVDWSRLAFIAKDESVKTLDLRKALFLDTETTGIAGGAGTCAFLIGVAFVRDDDVVVRQYLMRDYHEEAAMLFDLYRMIQEFDAIVSFNGKCFDWPLLRDRFTLARFEPLRKNYVHLDLLHAARRLWRASLPSCSLDSLEAHVLKVAREQDIPGSLIPQRYFDFLRTKRAELLIDILEHNRSDVLSLVTLVGTLDLMAGKPAAEIKSDSLCWAIARLYVQDRQWHRAIEFLQQAASLNQSKAVRSAACSQLALIYRRLNLWDQAQAIWLMLAQENGDIQACEELAKFYEHICKDLGKARQFAKQGLALAMAKDRLRAAAFEHRLERLERKLARQEKTTLSVH